LPSAHVYLLRFKLIVNYDTVGNWRGLLERIVSLLKE